MRHAEVTNATVLFPFLHYAHDRPRVHQAVTLHEIDLVAPEPFHRTPELSLCMAVVTEPFASDPDLVGNEKLPCDAQGRRVITNVHLCHAIERGCVDDPAAAVVENFHDFAAGARAVCRA